MIEERTYDGNEKIKITMPCEECGKEFETVKCEGIEDICFDCSHKIMEKLNENE